MTEKKPNWILRLSCCGCLIFVIAVTSPIWLTALGLAVTAAAPAVESQEEADQGDDDHELRTDPDPGPAEDR